MSKTHCEWKLDYDGIWETGCAGMFEFIDGGPSANKFKWCPYCGLIINDATGGPDTVGTASRVDNA